MSGPGRACQLRAVATRCLCLPATRTEPRDRAPTNRAPQWPQNTGTAHWHRHPHNGRLPHNCCLTCRTPRLLLAILHHPVCRRGSQWVAALEARPPPHTPPPPTTVPTAATVPLLDPSSCCISWLPLLPSPPIYVARAAAQSSWSTATNIGFRIGAGRIGFITLAGSCFCPQQQSCFFGLAPISSGSFVASIAFRLSSALMDRWSTLKLQGQQSTRAGERVEEEGERGQQEGAAEKRTIAEGGRAYSIRSRAHNKAKCDFVDAGRQVRVSLPLEGVVARWLVDQLAQVVSTLCRRCIHPQSDARASGQRRPRNWCPLLLRVLLVKLHRPAGTRRAF